MPNEQIFENEQIIKDAAIKRLRQRRTNLDVIKFNEPEPLVGEFPIADIKAGDPEGKLKSKLESWLKEKGLGGSIQPPALYVIEFVGDYGELNKLLNKHGTEHDKKYGTKNDENERDYNLTPKNKKAKDGTTVLYVGKSEKKIRQRLREHLLGVSMTTGALHLLRWVPAIKGTLTVKVRTIRGEPDWLKKGVKNALKDVKDALKDLEKGALKDLDDALKEDALKDLEKDALKDLEEALQRRLQPVFGGPGGR